MQILADHNGMYGGVGGSGGEDAPVDIVSAAIMAKVLEERERERQQTQHCESCRCTRSKARDVATQTSDHVAVTILPASIGGHSNILLDNVYRGSSPLSTSSCRSAVLVHSPRPRLSSTASEDLGDDADDYP